MNISNVNIQMDSVVDVESLDVLHQIIKDQNDLIRLFLEKSQPKNAYGIYLGQGDRNE